MANNQTCYCDPAFIPTASDCAHKSTHEACLGFTIATLIMFGGMLGVVVWEIMFQIAMREGVKVKMLLKYGFKMKCATYLTIVLACVGLGTHILSCTITHLMHYNPHLISHTQAYFIVRIVRYSLMLKEYDNVLIMESLYFIPVALDVSGYTFIVSIW